VSAIGAPPIMVVDDEGLQSMTSYLFDSGREQPAVALTSGSAGDLLLGPDEVRPIVGPARIYLVMGSDALLHLEALVGPSLALPASAARIWWPELTLESDPLEHPVVPQLEDEPEAAMLAEFIRCFELTRPVVRCEIKLIEDAQVMLERELQQARELQRRTDERLRDTQAERHEQALRADLAEASLASATAKLDALRISIGRAPERGTRPDDE
jgi:hypothetical protein